VDQRSFEEFYLGTRVRLLRQLAMMTGDAEQAADVLQEAYIRAWQRWGKVAGLESPEGWVRTVAWRVAVSQHRRHLVGADRVRRLFGSHGQVDDHTDHRVEAMDLQTALAHLSPDHRRVLVLHEMAGLSVREVAAETGVPEGTVKSRLSRAREAMSAALGRGYPLSGSSQEAEVTLS
jgi:RNA polymerase sigma-70 factor (ECF subfamily)